MLKALHLNQVGPAPEFDVEFATRLNLLTGDNGLGKTFLLDIAWWALTGTWVDHPAWPQRGKGGKPTITYHLIGNTGPTSQLTTSTFDFSSQAWRRPRTREPLPGLVLYCRVDGGFSVWDPARNDWKGKKKKGVDFPDLPNAYHFTPDTLWNGLEEGDKVLCNGLIRDWVGWQNQQNQDDTSPFQFFSQVIRHLSPPPGEGMEPGRPTRVSIEDVRDIPTIDFPYGNVPVIYASASIKRILGLAYLLVWTWYEHKQAAFLLNQAPTSRLILLIDEVEAHLHPRWQRSLVAAILEVATILTVKIQTQVIATTHSPLILASVEPVFDETQDKLFLFALEEQAVTLTEVPWAKQGDTIGWLTSEIFGLKQARSREAELAIEAAEAWMRDENMSAFPENLRTPEQIHRELERLLPGHDPFWPRWIVTTEGRHP